MATMKVRIIDDPLHEENRIWLLSPKAIHGRLFGRKAMVEFGGFLNRRQLRQVRRFWASQLYVRQLAKALKPPSAVRHMDAKQYLAFCRDAARKHLGRFIVIRERPSRSDGHLSLQKHRGRACVFIRVDDINTAPRRALQRVRHLLRTLKFQWTEKTIRRLLDRRSEREV